MTVADIARALGAARRSGPWWRCRCPVHESRGATLALRIGRGVFAESPMTALDALAGEPRRVAWRNESRGGNRTKVP